VNRYILEKLILSATLSVTENEGDKANQDILRKFNFNKTTHKSRHKLSIMFSAEIKSYGYMSKFLSVQYLKRFYSSEIIDTYTAQFF